MFDCEQLPRSNTFSIPLSPRSIETLVKIFIKKIAKNTAFADLIPQWLTGLVGLYWIIARNQHHPKGIHALLG